MALTVLFSAPAMWWPLYRPELERAFAAEGLDVRLTTSPSTPETVDYIVLRPDGPVRDFATFTNARAALSLWAGVEGLIDAPGLAMPLCRMVDPSLTAGMVEWVSGHVLRHHLGMDAHILGQDGVWRGGVIPPLARERRVGVLGLGALGSAAARALAAIGFDVRGWSRTAREIPDVQVRSGPDGLGATLAESEILVLLLPATPATEKLLDAARLALLPSGAVIVNPGRGGLLDDAALIAALDAGRLGHATLDVFRTEPLAPDHPFWAHPRVTVTPHIASETRPASAADVIARNIRSNEDGRGLRDLVDRRRGY